jgi:hypothetical protein
MSIVPRLKKLFARLRRQGVESLSAALSVDDFVDLPSLASKLTDPNRPIDA